MKKLSLIILSLLLLAGCGSKSTSQAVESSTSSEKSEVSEESSVVEETSSEIEESSMEEESSEEEQSQQEEVVVEETNYLPVIEKYAEHILFNSYDFEDGFTGVSEIVWSFGHNEAMNMVGYIEKDLDQDGVNELIIGTVPSEDSNVTSILACYTMKEGEPTLLFSGWGRNNFQMLSDGRIANAGSSGYATTAVGQFHIEKGQIVWDTFYFSDLKDETTHEIGYYTNSIGLIDKDASEEMDIQEEEFWNLYTDNFEGTVPLELTSFADSLHPEVSICEAEDIQNPDVVLSDGEYSIIAKIAAFEDISQVAFYDLTMTAGLYDVIGFEKTELVSVSDMLESDSITVQLQFMGDSPTLAIGFVNKHGYQRYYAITQSGFDGSLLLSRIK